MGLSAQCILPGHFTVTEIVSALAEIGLSDVRALPRYRPEHWEFRFVADDRSECIIDAFLNSWAADDYLDAFTGQSTLLTMPSLGGASSIFQMLARARPGSRWRTHEGENWQ
jgi:hypothetical protein